MEGEIRKEKLYEMMKYLSILRARIAEGLST